MTKFKLGRDVSNQQFMKLNSSALPPTVHGESGTSFFFLWQSDLPLSYLSIPFLSPFRDVWDILWCLSLNTTPNLSLLKGRTNSEDIHGDLHCKPFSQGLSNLAVPKGQYGISKDVPWCRGVASYFKAVWSCKVYIPHVVSRGVWGSTLGKFC